jgi:2-oxo-4-hydroxy-4-carboxy-5-ureidoimidazoline decarboxylase
MTIGDFDKMPLPELKEQLFRCCGSTAWVEKMVSVLPVEDMIDLFQYAEEKWNECTEADWKEAFDHHPQIGNTTTAHEEDKASAAWAKDEQSKVADADENIKQKLTDANRQYREKFGYIFIINATGKSAEEILAELIIRLQNSPEAEIEIAMYEQVGITRLRLERLLQEE